MADAQIVGRAIGSLAELWASFPRDKRTPERYRTLMLAIDTGLRWMAPIHEPEQTNDESR